MKACTTFGIQFITRAAKNPVLPMTIFVRITVNSRRAELSLKQTVLASEWSVEKGMSKGRTIEAKRLNAFLEQIRGRINECYQQLLIKKLPVTAEAIKNLYLGVKEETYNLLSTFDYHNTAMKDTLEWGTLNPLCSYPKAIACISMNCSFSSSDLCTTDFRFVKVA
ncbi:MAG: hypothetical protein JXR39_08595 [Marinilabiliaceae bacterium]|nr:hypothetical protein [Marinilabiliaceae bacterium]